MFPSLSEHVNIFFFLIGRKSIRTDHYLRLEQQKNDKLYPVSTTPTFTKNNNYTIFTKNAVHNESNCALEKKERRSEDANKSVAIVKVNFDKKISLF